MRVPKSTMETSSTSDLKNTRSNENVLTVLLSVDTHQGGKLTGVCGV